MCPPSLTGLVRGADPESTAPSWLAKAQEDLQISAELARLGHPGASAFHAQQAAEKAFKAVQVHRSATFDRTHDLTRLAKVLKAGARLEEAAVFLSPFYTAARYPDVPGGVTAADADQARRLAGEVIAWALKETS